MNLTIGCKEGEQYYLMNGDAIDKQEWTSLVKSHIKQMGNEEVFEKIKETVKLWNKHDTIEEVAIQIYASKYCTNLQLDKRRRAEVSIKVIHDELGYQQLAFC